MHRVLVVGVGSIGERHLRCFQATGRALVSFVEVNAALRQTIAERYSVPQTFDSLEAALTVLPDIAVICTPAALHVPQADRLAEAGVHILIEKPLSTSLEGTDRLRDAIAANRVTAGVAYVYRAHPMLAAMRTAIASDRFGRPLQLVAVSGQHFPTYRPAYRTIYYRDRAQGGGAIQDALTHVLNAGEWLVGPIDRLVVDAAHLALDGVDVEDTVHLLARHGSVLASYSLNQHQAPNESTITVVCDRGTARFEIHGRRWRWLTEPEAAWQEESLPTMERDTLFVAQANAFLDAVEGTAPLLCPFDDGLQTLRVNLAALESLSEGNWVRTRSCSVKPEF